MSLWNAREKKKIVTKILSARNIMRFSNFVNEEFSFLWMKSFLLFYFLIIIRKRVGESSKGENHVLETLFNYGKAIFMLHKSSTEIIKGEKFSSLFAEQ